MVGGSQPGAAAITKAGDTKRRRSATWRPPCRLNRPSPDQRWTISFAASRPRRSSTCSPPSVTARLGKGDRDVMRRFAWYGRLSTKDKQDPTLSFPSQRESCATKAAELGGEIVCEFTDQEAGRRDDRAGW